MCFLKSFLPSVCYFKSVTITVLISNSLSDAKPDAVSLSNVYWCIQSLDYSFDGSSGAS